jgi:hypothetical protein
MPNWCSTNYHINGDKEEIKELSKILQDVEDGKFKGSVDNVGFDAWLGYVVEQLGKSWHDVSCRGEFNSLNYEDDWIEFSTETAWCPCDEVLSLMKEKFPSIDIYYMAEEGGCGLYETNDADGEFFPERYKVEAYDGSQFDDDYFEDMTDVYTFLSNFFDKDIQSEDDLEELKKEIAKDDNSYFYINKFEVVEEQF